MKRHDSWTAPTSQAVLCNETLQLKSTESLVFRSRRKNTLQSTIRPRVNPLSCLTAANWNETCIAKGTARRASGVTYESSQSASNGRCGLGCSHGNRHRHELDAGSWSKHA